MATEKRRLGYRTPAAEIQDKFLEITRLLDVQEVRWDKLRQEADETATKTIEELESIAKSGSAKPEAINLLNHTIDLMITLRFIGALGMGMAETHKRLAKVEKAVNELKRAMKA
ncbi:MAG: hypothetical protein FJ012_07940 [Chloroflexi bacterium]|nr:hypothetical protein [Chloroflexota bacterium]